MACKAMQMWSLSGLVAAFLDLSIAYLLLCASALAFFASKFLGFLGLSLPCPCDGLFFSIPFKDYCVSRLLVDFPTQKVANVQFSVKKRFPFDDSMRAKSSGNYVNKFIEMEGEASCSSVSDSRRRNVVDREEFSVEKYDVKGKGVVIDHRPRSRLRKRRKGWRSRGCSSVSSSYDPFQSEEGDSNKVYVGTRLHLPKYVDDKNASDEDRRVMRNIMPIEDLKYTQPNIEPFSGDEKDIIRMLEQELEEERDAHSALYIELEKERSAAASAADEAMAMILRLQEEKASIGMEARQYQRILEEKSAYDAEEMDILKEILMRREREKLFMEKEVEAYRQIVSLENKQTSGNFSGLASDTDDNPQGRLSRPTEPAELPLCDNAGYVKLQEKEVLSAGNDSYLTGMGVEECKFVERPEGPEGKELAQLENKNLGHKLDNDTRVYDVHVIGDASNGLSYDSTEASVTKKGLDSTEVNMKRSNSDVSGLPPVGPKGKALLNLRRSSMSAVESEMLKIDFEVSKLRERLKVVREGRDKLSLSVDNREGESRQLKLLEDITRQIQEIRYLTEPGLSGKQDLSKKRRCRSVSSGLHRRSKG